MWWIRYWPAILIVPSWIVVIALVWQVVVLRRLVKDLGMPVILPGEELIRLRKAIVFLAEATSQRQIVNGAWHDHKILSPEDKRQLELTLGLEEIE